jgi:PAS domain S-box-containing protein
VWLLLGASIPTLLAGLWLVRRRERSPSGLWIGGWLAAAMGGLLLLLADRWPPLLPLSLVFGTLFPWFLLGGALRLAERPLPAWLLPLALGLGVLRAAVAQTFGAPVAHAAGLVTDIPAALAAALWARRAIPPSAPSTTQRALPGALLVLSGLGALHLYWQALERPHEWLLALWLFATPPLLGLQLRVGAEWTRRHLERAQRALEETIAQRTAELARVNESLRRSEERYRTVSELSSDLSFGFRVEKGGRVVGEWVTEAFGRMTGFALPEVQGAGWLGLIHPDDRAWMERAFLAAVPEGMGSFTFRIVGKHGEVRWLEARDRILRDESGIHVVGAARDVTAQRQAEEERLRLERQVQETQRLESLGLVTGGVAHDFNNLLAVILGNAKLALGELAASDRLRPRLERILAAAEHGAGLTEQMLVYAGRAPRAQKPVDLSSLVAEMLDLARASLPPGVELREELGAGVWVRGDETQLRQVVLNLVANAGEAMRDRPGSVVVRTARRAATPEDLAKARGADELAPGPCVVLEVGDEGAGMDEATRERVFEPFFSTKLRGRGLGLAAVLGIVRGHGGRIDLDSAPGQGSRFRVWLPEGTRMADAPAAAPAARPVEARRVLVIDDQEALLELSREYLARAGYHVETALGGRAGLEAFATRAAALDAVVLDLAMPDVDGEQVGREIRAQHPALPLLLVSGYDANLAASRFEGLRPARFLRKPYERDDLLVELERLLEGD